MMIPDPISQMLAPHIEAIGQAETARRGETMTVTMQESTAMSKGFVASLPAVAEISAAIARAAVMVQGDPSDGRDQRERIIDAVTDLMHLAHENGHNPGEIIAIAQVHFQAERSA